MTSTDKLNQTGNNNKIASIGVICKPGQNQSYLLLGIRAKDGKFSLSAGHAKPNESITDCAIRELFEETGIKVSPEQIVEIGTESHKDEIGESQADSIGTGENQITAFKVVFDSMPATDHSKDPDQEFDTLVWMPLVDGKLQPSVVSNIVGQPNLVLQLLGCIPEQKKQLIKSDIIKINNLYLRKSKVSTKETDVWNILSKSKDCSGKIRIEKKQPKQKDIVEAVKYKQAPITTVANLTHAKDSKWIDTDSMSDLLLALSSHYGNLSVSDRPTGSKQKLKKSVSSDCVRTPGQTIKTGNTYLVLQKSSPTEKGEIKSNWAIYLKDGEKAGEMDTLHKKGENNLAIIFRNLKLPEEEVPMVDKDPQQGGSDNIEDTFKRFGIKKYTPEITKGLSSWFIRPTEQFVESAKKKAENLEKCLPFFPMSRTEKMRTHLNLLKDALKEITKVDELKNGNHNIFENLKPIGALAAFKQKYWHLIVSDGDKKIDISEQEAKDYEKDRQDLLECCADLLPKEILPVDIKFLANIVHKGGK